MKKFFRILAATMLLAVMATTLCSCGVPSDAAKAKANLEKNGYTVFMVQGSYKGDIISIKRITNTKKNTISCLKNSKRDTTTEKLQKRITINPKPSLTISSSESPERFSIAEQKRALKLLAKYN